MAQPRNRYLYDPSQYDYRRTIGVNTSWMDELRNPEKIADSLDRLRKGTLRRKKLNLRSFELEDSGELFPKVEFDTVVGTGFSGILPLLYVANKLDVNWFAVRKSDDVSHTDEGAEGQLGRKWLFLDDFVETGATYKHVLEVVAKGSGLMNFHTEHVGIFQYHSPRDAFVSPDNPTIQERLNRLEERERYERFAI